MYVEKEMREKLSALTTELFSKPNLWRKMLERGYAEPVKEDADTKKKYGKFGPRGRKGGQVRMLERKHYTVESLLEWLENLKKDIDKMKAEKNVEARSEKKI